MYLTQRLHGRGHPKVAAALGSLATLAEQQLDYGKSILLHEQSLEIKRRCLGPEHQTVSTTLVNIARVREKLGDLDAALGLREKALEIVRQGRAEGAHPQVAIMLNNIAVLEARRRNYLRATELVQEALEIDEATYGARHPQVAADLNTLATLAFHCGEKHLSRQLYQRAYEIRRDVLGSGHAKTQASKQNLDLVVEQIAADDAAMD